MRRQLIGFGVLAVAAALCSVALGLVGAPSPALFGGLAAAVGVALLMPDPPRMPRLLGRAAQALVGVIVAAGVDFEALAHLGSAWPWVVLVIALTMAVSLLLGMLLTRAGVSRVTAAFASIAGGASSMTAIAQDFGADQRIVVVVQYFRVLLVLTTLPIVVTQVFSSEVAGGDAAASAVTGIDLAFLAIAVAVGPLLGHLLRIPAPALLGAMSVGLALKAGGLFTEATVPAVVVTAAFLLIGVQAGLGFTPDALRVLRRLFPPVLVSSVLLIGFCAALSVPFARITGATALDAYLATSPGGLPVVLATASETAGDLTFVTAVQVLRVLAIMLLVPLVTVLLRRFRRRD